MAMFSADDTQFPKRRKFDIANIESPVWRFYARCALSREPLERTAPTSEQNLFIVASQARRRPEAEHTHIRAHEERFRATVVAEEGDLRGGINLQSVLISSNGRPMSLPPPSNLLTISVGAVGQPGGLGFNRCPAGKAADAKKIQGSIPDIDTRADSDVSLACHNGSCECYAKQETQCVLAVPPHRTGLPNNSRAQNRPKPKPKDEKPETPLQFLACGPAAVVLALDPALEEGGGDTWSVKEETVMAHDKQLCNRIVCHQSGQDRLGGRARCTGTRQQMKATSC